MGGDRAGLLDSESICWDELCLHEVGRAWGVRAQALRFILVDLASDLCRPPASSPVTLTDLDFSAT